MGQVFIGHLTQDDILFKDTGELIPDNLGGATIYAASGASIWSKDNHIVSKVGKNYPYEKLKNFCEKRNIDISAIRKTDCNGIELIIEYDSGMERKFIAKENSGDNYSFAPEADDIPEDLIKGNDVFHITIIPVEMQIEIAKRIKEYPNKSITLDPLSWDIVKDKKALWLELFKHVDYPMLSKLELLAFQREIYGNFNNNISLNFLPQFKSDFNIKNMVLKAGSKGSYLALGDRITHIPSYPTVPKDVTGAGDAFAGGFAVAQDKSESLLTGMYYGTVSASYIIEDFGFEHIQNTDETSKLQRLQYLKNEMKENEQENLPGNKAI